MASHSVNEASFDIIEEIQESDEHVQLRNIASSSSASMAPTTTTTTYVGKGKSPVKSTTFAVTTKQPTKSVIYPMPSTSRGPSSQAGPSGFVDCGSDTSSAAGFGKTDVHSPSRITAMDQYLEIEPVRLEDTQMRGVASRSASQHSIEYADSLLTPIEVPVDDPILIRGNGNMTLFGLSNSFSNTFPSPLLGRVSREEFEHTMVCINHLLQQQHSTNAKFLLLGCLCCCCSLGCSLLWPTVALSKRTRNSLDKLLALENSRLYNKLGLNWHVSKQQCHTNHSFMEYVLIIDFLPKLQIYQPD